MLNSDGINHTDACIAGGQYGCIPSCIEARAATRPTGPREYIDYTDDEGMPAPAHPMLCADCNAPVFYADDQYWHAVSNPHPQCFGPASWIAGDVDDPQHPAYAGWKEVHP